MLAVDASPVDLHQWLVTSFVGRHPQWCSVAGLISVCCKLALVNSGRSNEESDHLTMACAQRPVHAMQVSVACRDLLKQMLTAEPSKRISIGGIMNHPWFLKDLPAGTHEMNARLQATDNVRSVHNQNVPTAASSLAASMCCIYVPSVAQADLSPREPSASHPNSMLSLM